MTTARKDIIDLELTQWYHCISNCVREEALLSPERQAWIEQRLEKLSASFAIGVAGYSILDTHLHMSCLVDVEQAMSWSNEDVVRRWSEIYKPEPLPSDADKQAVEAWVKTAAQDAGFVDERRNRLMDLGWFHKALKEPLATFANKEDGKKGPFWQPRFKSIAILDEQALLTVLIYIALNRVAAGIDEFPELSNYTSIKSRVDFVMAEAGIQSLAAAKLGTVADSEAMGEIEQRHWLVPIEDRRQLPGANKSKCRRGALATFSIGSYLMLVDKVSRIQRKGKAAISEAARGIFDRIAGQRRDPFGMVDNSGIAKTWAARLDQMLQAQSFRGHFMASDGSIDKARKKFGRRIIDLRTQVS